MKQIFALLMIVPLAACSGGVGGVFGGRDDVAAEPRIVAVPPAETIADGTGVVPPSGDGRVMGFTVATLGDASLPGLWIETPLVTEDQAGRVVSENGMQLLLVLRPSGGDRSSGSRLSLAAYQALGIPLTALPTLTVISDA